MICWNNARCCMYFVQTYGLITTVTLRQDLNSHCMCWTRGQIRWVCLHLNARKLHCQGDHTFFSNVWFCFQYTISTEYVNCHEELNIIHYNNIYIYTHIFSLFLTDRQHLSWNQHVGPAVASFTASGTLTFPSDAPEWTEQEFELFVGPALSETGQWWPNQVLMFDVSFIDLY